LTVLVLGARGFVGSAVKECFEASGVPVFFVSTDPAGALDPKCLHVERNSEVPVDELREFLKSREIRHVINCVNSFERTPDIAKAIEMLKVNFLFPATVLRIATEEPVTSFTNVASGWQIRPERARTAPDYVGSKEAFRQFMSAYSKKIQTRTIFVNEIFGPGDTRTKLINSALLSWRNGEPYIVRSKESELGLCFMPRLADEIVQTVLGKVCRPDNYIYENYSRISVSEVMESLKIATGIQGVWVDQGESPEGFENTQFPKLGEQGLDLLITDLSSM